jgi:hypothetical protein
MVKIPNPLNDHIKPQKYRFGLRDPHLVYGDDIYEYLQNL